MRACSFVTGGFDRFLRVWDTETGQVVQTVTNRKVGNKQTQWMDGRTDGAGARSGPTCLGGCNGGARRAGGRPFHPGYPSTHTTAFLLIPIPGCSTTHPTAFHPHPDYPTTHPRPSLQVPYCVRFYPLDNNLFIVGMSDNRLYTFDIKSGRPRSPMLMLLLLD